MNNTYPHYIKFLGSGQQFRSTFKETNMANTILLQNDNFTMVHPELINRFGRSRASFISQLHYWIKKNQGIVHDGKRFVYNTADEWGDQLRYSSRTITRIIKDLVEAGVIIVKKLAWKKSDRTNYYALNYEMIAEIDAKIIKKSKNRKTPEKRHASAKKKGDVDESSDTEED
jgi:hypothetical protein